MSQRTLKNDNYKLDNLLRSMDKTIADSFSYKQRKAMSKSLNNQEWGKHKVDFRPTIAVPFVPRSFYVVFIAGTNRRGLSNSEKVISFLMLLLVLFVGGILAVCFALIGIYIVKSWIGIDLFPNESLGLWSYIKDIFTK